MQRPEQQAKEVLHPTKPKGSLRGPTLGRPCWASFRPFRSPQPPPLGNLFRMYSHLALPESKYCVTMSPIVTPDLATSLPLSALTSLLTPSGQSVAVAAVAAMGHEQQSVYNMRHMHSLAVLSFTVSLPPPPPLPSPPSFGNPISFCTLIDLRTQSTTSR